MSPSELEKRIKTLKIKYVLAQFVDIHGVAKTKSVPIKHLKSVLTEGAGFAAFAVEGFGIGPHGPDYMAVGDPNSFRAMPWMPGFGKISCNGHIRGKPHTFDSRVVCLQALDKLRKKTGMEFYTGLEPEFFLLRQDPETKAILLAEDSDILSKPCYDFKVYSRLLPVLKEISDSLIAAGLDVYQIDHEDANSQFEINFTYANALKSADDFIFVKMAAGEIARKHGLICSFMPKPFSTSAGNGMHMHLSLGKNGKNAFHDASDKNGLELSKLAYQFLGGILEHAEAITAIACPTVNSYKRLYSKCSVSGATWAPTSICYGDNNRTAMVRIPVGRIELRIPDSACNPYLLTAAVATAGLDGIERNLDPGSPMNENLYEMSSKQKEKANIQGLPKTLVHALDALEKDEVIKSALGQDLTQLFIKLKRNEWNDYHRHVSDWETHRYLDFF